MAILALIVLTVASVAMARGMLLTATYTEDAREEVADNLARYFCPSLEEMHGPGQHQQLQDPGYEGCKEVWARMRAEIEADRRVLQAATRAGDVQDTG